MPVRLALVLLVAAALAATEPVHRFATLAGCLPDGPCAHDLILEWIEDDGTPRPECWALSPSWNGAEHHGRIARAADGSLAVELVVEPDPWVGGGVVRITLAADRRTWHGAAFGVDGRSGAVDLRGYPLRPAPIAGFVAPAADERPRLLLRARDLPAARAFAATDAGKDLLHRLEETCKLPVVGGDYDLGYRAAGFALIGLLTGRQDATDTAREMTLRCIKSATAQGETGGYASYFAGVALAYDLAGSAWPEPARAPIRAYLATWSDLFTTMHVPINQGQVPLMRSGHFQQSPSLMRFRSGTLLASLALLGEPTPFTRPEPKRPPLPVEPGPAAPPAEGLPRAAAPGAIDAWLLAGPFAADPTAPAELRANAGGNLDGQPWQAVTAQAAKANPFGPAGAAAVRLPGPGRWVLHGALRTATPGALRWRSGGDVVRAWIAGAAVDEGGLVSLPAGDHAITLVALVAPGRPATLAPRLEPADAGEVASARREAESWSLRHVRWTAQKAAHEASGGTASMRENATTALRGLARSYAEAHGETGWPGANNTADGCVDKVAMALVATRNVLGLDLAPREDDRLWKYLDSAWVRLPNGNGDDLYVTGVEPFTAFLALPEGPRRERFRSLVRARLDRIGTRLGRFDYADAIPLMVAITRHADLVGATRPPHEGLPRQQIDREQASAVFRDRIDDQIAAVRVLAIGAQRPVGLGRRDQAHAGAIAMRRGRENWLPYHRGHDDVYYGRAVLSVPEFEGLEPVAGAGLLAATLADDGGGTVAWDLGVAHGGAFQGRRDVAVAFPGGDVAMVLALRDRFTGTAGRAWTWRLAQGSAPRLDADGLGAVLEQQGWRCTLRLTAPAGARLAWRKPRDHRYATEMLDLPLAGDGEVRAVVVLHQVGVDPAIAFAEDGVAGGGRRWALGGDGFRAR